jgi:hypothetical protein
MALSDTAVRGANPGQKLFKMYDRDGLFPLVNAGVSKLWRWRHRFDGKEKLIGDPSSSSSLRGFPWSPTPEAMVGRP